MTETGNGAPADEALVATACADPEGAEGRRAASDLLARYQERVFLWCLRMLRDRERAMELTQEVLLLCYRSLSSFEERARFSSWLFAIARNRCLSELRRPSLLVDDDADIGAREDPAAGPDVLLERKLEGDALLRLIRSVLEPQEQEAIWLRCVENMPVETITRVLQVKGASGARGLLQRARRKLAPHLEPGGRIPVEPGKERRNG